MSTANIVLKDSFSMNNNLSCPVTGTWIVITVQDF